MTVIAILGQALGLVLVGLAGGRGMLVAGAAVLGAAHGAVFPILSSQVVDRARTAERGSAVAIFTSIIDVALLAIAPVVGLLIDGGGYDVAFPAVGALLTVGALVYTLWDRRLFRPALQPAPADSL